MILFFKNQYFYSGYQVSESSCNLLQVTPGRRGSRAFAPPESDKRNPCETAQVAQARTSLHELALLHVMPVQYFWLLLLTNVSRFQAFDVEYIRVRIALLASRCHRHVSCLGQFPTGYEPLARRFKPLIFLGETSYQFT